MEYQKIQNLEGLVSSLQISHLENAKLGISYKIPMLIKNIGDDAEELVVRLWNAPSTIKTVFECGWNPELIQEIVSGNITNIQVGY